MPKSKKGKQNQGIVSSYTRARNNLAISREQSDRIRFAEKTVEDSKRMEPINPPDENNLTLLRDTEPVTLGYTQEMLDARKIEVMRGEMSLPSDVKLLFELTRDGKAVTPEYESELKLPHVKAEDMADAIELGIKAWAPSLFSKER
jgi:hypothetical protein